jgi:hypothetical protein
MELRTSWGSTAKFRVPAFAFKPIEPFPTRAPKPVDGAVVMVVPTTVGIAVPGAVVPGAFVVGGGVGVTGGGVGLTGGVDGPFILEEVGGVGWPAVILVRAREGDPALGATPDRPNERVAEPARAPEEPVDLLDAPDPGEYADAGMARRTSVAETMRAIISRWDISNS